MKLTKILGLVLFVNVWSFTTFSQTEIVVDSPEYHQAKDNGTLDQYTIVQDLGLQIANGTAKPAPSTGRPKSTDCDCFVQPDGTYSLALAPNDDGSSSLINLPFSFNFYGTMYNSLYINNNGNITFGTALATFSSTAFPSANNRIIAPFWADVDTRGGFGQVLYKITPTAIFINWQSVGYYNTQGDKRNTFQLILTNGSDAAVPDGNNVAFCYQDMQWTTGAASCDPIGPCSYNGSTYTCGGSGGFCGVPATCGANKGDNVGYFLIGRYDHPGNDFDGPLGNNDGISYLDYKSFFFDITGALNTPPIAQGVSSCDTFKICSYGDTADIMVTFLSPELNQTTSITYNNGGLNSLQEIANVSGNTANLVLRVIGDPSDAGTYNMTVTATDDFSPTPGVTTISFVVIIDNSGTSLNPELSYTTACDSFVVSVLNGPYDGYLWDNQTVYPTTHVTETGVFGVTVNIDNCYKRVEEYIYVPEPANFNLQGNLYLCPGEDSTFLTIGDSLAIDFMDWNLGGPNDGDFSMWLTPGTYTIYNQDSSGYCQNDTTFTIGQGVSSIIFPDGVSCNNLSYQVTGAFAGTGAIWSSPDPEISFSSTTASNPIITASTYGIYTINLSTPCANDLETQLIYTFTPTIFPNDTVCGSTYNVDPSTVNSLNGGIWSTVSPSVISFSNDTINNPVITTNVIPFNAQIIYTDKYCPSLSDYATILFVPSGMPTIPETACDLTTFGLSVDSYFGGMWSVIDNPSTAWLEDTAAVFIYGNTVEQPGMHVSTPGTYTVHYEDPFCGISVSETIDFLPYMYTEVIDTTLCAGVEFELGAWQPPYPGVTYAWNTGATTPTIIVNQPGDYIVTVSNACHSASDTATITYYVCDIAAPNVISLSSQSGNNTWFVNADGIADFECVIVNRWGNIIYEFNDVNGSWNGQDRSGNVVSEGVYFYTIKAKVFGGEELTKHGFIQVVH